MSSQRQDSLLTAARRLLVEGGPDALTMDALAEAAGLSRATVYRRVGSREALLETLAAEGLDVGPRSPPREAILRACREVFGRLGFDRATVEDIAEAAGVAPATVYRHFGDKVGLIGAFADAIGGRAAVRDLSPQLTGALRDDLLLMTRGLLHGMSRDADLVALGLVELLTGTGHLLGARKSTGSVYEAVTHLLERHMEQGTLPRTDATQLAALFVAPIFAFTQILPRIRPGAPVDLDALAPQLVDHFLHGALGASRSE